MLNEVTALSIIPRGQGSQPSAANPTLSSTRGDRRNPARAIPGRKSFVFSSPLRSVVFKKSIDGLNIADSADPASVRLTSISAQIRPLEIAGIEKGWPNFTDASLSGIRVNLRGVFDRDSNV